MPVIDEEIDKALEQSKYQYSDEAIDAALKSATVQVPDSDIDQALASASQPLPTQEPELIPPPGTGRMSLARFKKRGELSEERVRNELDRQNLPTGQDSSVLENMLPNVTRLLPQGAKDAALMGVASGVGDAISQVGGVIGAVGAAGKDVMEGKGKWQDYLLTAPAAMIPGLSGVYDKAGKILTQFGEKLSAKYNPAEIGNPGGAVTEFIHGATSTGVASLPAMALGWAGGLPAAIGGGALQSFGAGFNTAKKTYMERDNLSEDEAAQKALIPALGEGLATAAVMAIFGKRGSLRFLKLKDAPHEVDLTIRSAIKEITHGAIEEGAEELTDQALQSYVAFKTYRPDMTLGDAVMESIQAGVYGAVLGGVVNAGVSGGRLTIQKMAEGTLPEISRLDPVVQQLVNEGSARTEATPPPIPQEPVKQVTEEQFTKAIQQQNKEREKANPNDILTIAGNELASLEQQTDLMPAEDQRRGLLRLFLEKPTIGTARTLAVMFDLQLDPEATEFPSKYKPKGGEVSAETKTSSQTQVQAEEGVGPPAVRVQEVIPVPVAPTPQPVTATGTFGIRFTPAVKALSKVVESLNPSLKTASISKIQVNNAQAESVVAPEPGVVTVNPQKLFEETKGMTEAARAKHIEGLVKAQTGQFTDPDTGPRYAAPSTQEGQTSVEDGVRQLSEALGSTALPSKLTVIHDPNLKTGGIFENGKVVINMAWTNDPVATLLHEGLHGIIEAIKKGEIVDTELKAALEEFASKVTQADTETEKARRQGLDLRDWVIAEEALVAKVLESSPSLLTRVLTAIRNAFKKAFGMEIPIDQRTRILDAAKAWLVNENTGQTGERRFSYAATPADVTGETGQTPTDRTLTAIHAIAQSAEVVGLFQKHGAYDLSQGAKDQSGYSDLYGIKKAADQINTGITPTYQGAKTTLTTGQRSRLSRTVHQRLSQFIMDSDNLIAKWKSESERMLQPGHLRRVARDAAATFKKDLTEMAMNVGASIFNSAYSLASDSLKAQAKNDRAIAALEGELKGIEAASQSPEAMRQILEDIVNVLASSDDSWAMLANMTGIQPDVTAREIVQAYNRAKSSLRAGETRSPYDPNLVQWASMVLVKSRNVREKLMAQTLSRDSSVQQNMIAYQRQVMAEMESNPKGVVKRALRDRGRLVTAAQKAAFAWQQLHEPLMKELNDFDELSDAAEVAQKVRQDPEFETLFRQVSKDAGRFGSKRFSPFTDTSMVLPDGTELTTDTGVMKGDKTEFSKVRKQWKDGIEQLQLWLNEFTNPQNKDHPDRKYYQDLLEHLENTYYGRAMLQPNDTTGVVKAVWGILRNAIDRAGGRVAAQVKGFLHDYERKTQLAGWWNQRWTARLEDSAITAFKSHDLQWSDYGGSLLFKLVEGTTVGTFADVNKEWWMKVGNELAASHAAQSGGMHAGELLGSGWRVTKEDLAFLKLQSDAGTAARAILGDKNDLRDTLGGVITYRAPSKDSPYMVPRMWNFDLRESVGLPISEAYKKLQAAKSQAEVTQAQNEMIAILDREFGAIGFSMIKDRGDHAEPTPYDGPSGAFKLIAEMMAQGQVSNMNELFNALDSLSTVERQDGVSIILNEWGRMISKWYAEAATKDAPKILRADESKNSFTKSRDNTIAPYVFYHYGFHTNYDLAVHAAGIYSRSLDDLAAGMNALISDLNRQKSALEANIRTGQTEEQVLKQNKKDLQSGETYDNYLDLEWKIKNIQYLHDAITGDRTDTDVDQTLARYIAVLTGAQISGVITTGRNITFGPLYMGSFFRALTASNAYSFPMSMWHAWVIAMPKIFGTIGLSGAKGAIGLVWEPTKGLFKAIYKDPTLRDPKQFVATALGNVIQEIGNTAYERLKSLREMTEEGPNQTHFIPDSKLVFSNRLLGSMLNGGRLTRENLKGFNKWGQTALALFETYIGSFTQAYAPLFGDSALNMAVYDFVNSSVGPIAQLEKRLRAFLKTNGPLNLTDRFFTHQEIFPRWGLGRISSNAKDMSDLRSAFSAAGLDFDTLASRFLSELQAKKLDATFMTKGETTALVNAGINYSNRSTAANTPVAFRSRHPMALLIKPFFSWKARQFSNYLNIFRWPTSDSTKVAMVAAVMFTAYLLPTMLAGVAAREYDEFTARNLSSVLHNQVRNSRYFWERDGLKSQSLGLLTEAFGGVPFFDMAVTAMFDDMPNRASLDPSLVVIENAKKVAKYIGGAVQTGDWSYKLPELIGGILPDTRVVLNRLPSEEGKREAANVIALLRRNAPADMLRPQGSNKGGVNVTPYAPIIQRMENAAVRDDQTGFKNAYSEAVQRARSDGKPNPEGYVAQLFGARSAFNRALSGKMTQDQYDTFVSKLSPGDQANLAQYQSRFQAAAQSIGSPASFVKEDPSSGGGRSRAMTTGRTVGLASGTGRTRRLGRTRRIGRSIRSRRVGTRRRTGFRSRTRRF